MYTGMSLRVGSVLLDRSLCFSRGALLRAESKGVKQAGLPGGEDITSAVDRSGTQGRTVPQAGTNGLF